MSQESEEVSFGSDSFLDVMANMVGILIILVTIAVMHASRSRTTDPQPPPVEDLTALSQQAESLEHSLQAIAGEARGVDERAARQQAEYELLASRVTGRRQEFYARRQKLDLKTREKENLRISLVSARASLEEIELEVAQKKTKSTKDVTTIQCYPTPISHSVSGHEIHFRLHHGRIVYVPMEELMEAFQREAKARVELLRNRPAVTGTIGPERDFRMRYVLEREPINGGFKVEAMFTYLPVEPDLGEELQAAMAPNSEFREILGKANPRQTTVTLWAYPDSFGLYREVKRELYGRGFAVAGRPLEMGQPIGASTSGTKSAAQ